MMKKIIPFLLLILMVSTQSFAVDDETRELENASSQLKEISDKLKRGDYQDADLNNWIKLTIRIKSKADLCVSHSEKALLDLKKMMDSLGEKVKGEDADVTKKRQNYHKEKGELDKKLAKCNLHVANSDELGNLIAETEKSYFKQKFLVRGPDMIALVIAYLKNPTAIIEESGSFFFKRSGIREIEVINLVLSVTAVILSVLLGLWLRKKLLLLESKRQWNDDFSEKLMRALITTSAFALPYLIGSAVAAISALIITFKVEKIPFIAEALVGLLLFFLVATVIRLLFAPSPPARIFLPFTPNIADLLARRLLVLAVLSLVGYLAFYTVFSQSLVESNLLLARNIFSLFFVINVVWMLHVIIRSPKLPKFRYITWLVIIAMVLSLILEWMGYRNLAISSRQIIMVLFVTLVVFVGIAKIFTDLFDAIDEENYSWCRRLHKALGAENKKIPGLIWLRSLASIVIWGGFAVVIINTLDYSGGIMAQVRSYVINGFDVGDFRIVPGRILWALLLFGLIIILSSWVRSHLENNWLKMTSMGQGARDAMVTITGYVMFIIAIFVGLSAAGFDFGNIAIVAGALSVGIGFGLQNIVNNFVSGLILLFERPIRKGDWIVVGQTEGTVKDIQIRSTRIQTFDRSDVIVPNSELIANQVTNWVLSNKTGRAIIPIGVAYGTDTDKVREVLLAIAEENKDVVKSGTAPKPKVLFREFGDSALNFELRVFLHNVDSRLSVVSDINFAIDKAFREEGIEIPFPQRDLHVKSLPEQSESQQNRPQQNRPQQKEPRQHGDTEKSDATEPRDHKETRVTKQNRTQSDTSDFDADDS